MVDTWNRDRAFAVENYFKIFQEFKIFWNTLKIFIAIVNIYIIFYYTIIFHYIYFLKIIIIALLIKFPTHAYKSHNNFMF